MTDLIYDGNSLYARCWFAVKDDPEEALRSSILSTLTLLEPSNGRIGETIHRTMFCWDGSSKTEKERAPKPPGYVQTRLRLQKVLLTLFNTVHAWNADYEADDIAATAVYNSTSRQVILVSGDKDLMQLQGGTVTYYCLNHKQITTSRYIINKFGIKKPSQLAIALAILGDKVDNIPGIKGWGDKKVRKLFESVTEDMDFTAAYHTIEQQVPPQFKQVFLESLDKTLLHDDVPGVPEPSSLEFVDFSVVDDLGIEGISAPYDRVSSQYSGGDREGAAMRAIERHY